VAKRDFPDHHVFASREIARLVEEATRRRALLVTTEKDGVRLGPRYARTFTTLPVTLRFEDPRGVKEMLRRAFR
jgi:tetraacyldisaccharide 4'-kinase